MRRITGGRSEIEPTFLEPSLSSRPSAPRASGGIPSRQALAFPGGIPRFPRVLTDPHSLGMTSDSSGTALGDQAQLGQIPEFR